MPNITFSWKIHFPLFMGSESLDYFCHITLLELQKQYVYVTVLLTCSQMMRHIKTIYIVPSFSILLVVSVQLYSPRRPLVDIAEVFLWLMAVSTILCASYWSAWFAREAAIEHDKLLKV